jgi:hypothetical protein
VDTIGKRHHYEDLAETVEKQIVAQVVKIQILLKEEELMARREHILRNAL